MYVIQDVLPDKSAFPDPQKYIHVIEIDGAIQERRIIFFIICLHLCLHRNYTSFLHCTVEMISSLPKGIHLKIVLNN
jgi:hypothetical protein